MGKMVGVAEFKANCLKLIATMQRDGESLTLTKRGKVVAVLSPPPAAKLQPETLFGALYSPEYRFDDPFSPAHEGAWDAEK